MSRYSILFSGVLSLSLFAFSEAGAQIAPVAAATNSPLRQIGPDVFQVGLVRLDKGKRTVQFPARLTMNEGLIEYLLVSARGKTYESLLTTEARPFDIQLALLLLGAKGAPQTAALANAPSVPFHVNSPAGTPRSPADLGIVGDPVDIELAWRSEGKPRRLPAESLVTNLSTKTNAARGPWTYNGSRVVHGTFIAERDGSIVSMIDDIDAMLNNPRPGSDNDQIWQINTNAAPPLKTAVEVIFKLAPGHR